MALHLLPIHDENLCKSLCTTRLKLNTTKMKAALSCGTISHKVDIRVHTSNHDFLLLLALNTQEYRPPTKCNAYEKIP